MTPQFSLLMIAEGPTVQDVIDHEMNQEMKSLINRLIALQRLKPVRFARRLSFER